MKPLYVVLIFICQLTYVHAFAQGGTTAQQQVPKKTFTQRDSLYMTRLNTSGTLMIASGVGLCGAGSYLIYQGAKIYQTPAAPLSTDPSTDIARNHKQGTIYVAAGAVGIIGGVVLTSLGIRNKITFKQRKKIMSLQAGLLDTGNIGAMLTF